MTIALQSPSLNSLCCNSTVSYIVIESNEVYASVVKVNVRYIHSVA